MSSNNHETYGKVLIELEQGMVYAPITFTTPNQTITQWTSVNWDAKNIFSSTPSNLVK